MKRDDEYTVNQHSGLTRREFLAMLAGFTVSLMVPRRLHGGERTAAAAASGSDRLGKLLPLRTLGFSGPVVTNLGIGGAHVGSVSEKDAQAIIEKALEEGVRFFDNAPFYAGGRAEERYGRFLTPAYRDVSSKTYYVDVWQMHSLESPQDVEDRIKNGVLDAFLEAQKRRASSRTWCPGAWRPALACWP